ncbi:peroxisomal membrane protein PMP27 [[Candida] jaroonii]|uniref:Peroxisomal membrane protein PMP27 n=1 Tax=[Candida] jaroonii TaxID=467808 RepID=A0ACA9Y205_9ASCO|nr:peroxisomal membrane protein PMP27 [[Candida] jaroonii]
MVVDAVIYHPYYDKILRFLDTTPKREKLYRLVAYLSRFLTYYSYRMGFSTDTVNMFKELKSQVTFLRKGMRFLKPLHHLETASKTFDNKLMDPILQKTTVVRNLGYAGYLTIDAFIFLKMLGLVNKSKFSNASTWASRFWLLGLIAGVINSLRSYKINITKLNNKDEKVDVEDVKGKIFKAKRKLVWDLLDMFIALNSLNYLHFTEGDVGLAGSITSVMGLKDLWAAT